MKEIRCPNCGRENAARARYCMFCGMSMKGAEAVKKTKETQEEGRWNPEEAYARGKGGIIFLAVILIAAAAAAAFLLTFSRGHELRMPYGIRLSMSSEQVRQCMEENGFTSIWNPSGTDFRSTMYESARVLGEETEYSLTAAGKSGDSRQVLVQHVFQEEETGSFEHPGPVFRRLLNALEKDYGEPEKDEATGMVLWRNGKVIAALEYAGGNLVELTWAESDSF